MTNTKKTWKCKTCGMTFRETVQSAFLGAMVRMTPACKHEFHRVGVSSSCGRMELHNFWNLRPETRCRWCGDTVAESMKTRGGAA